MEAIASASITSAFGNGFLSEFIRDTYSFIKNSSQFPLVQDTILQLDLKNFIPLCQTVISYLSAKNQARSLPPHILITIEQLNNSVNLIRDQLAFIHNTLNTHKNKFLHSIRPPSLKKHLHKLTILKINAERQLNYILQMVPPDLISSMAPQSVPTPNSPYQDLLS
jgi:hypothetical protein